MPLLGAKSQIKNFIMLSVAASIIVAGCSEKSENDEVLDNMQAREIIAEYFEDVEFDRSVQADVYFGSKARADVLGSYDGKWIAVRYGHGDLEQGAPSISPDIDYYLNIPQGNKRFIHSVMTVSLKSAIFTPVLSRVEDFGMMKPLGAVKGMLEVRLADVGECQIVDAYLNCAGVFALKPLGKTKFQMPYNKELTIKNEYHCASEFDLVSSGEGQFQMPPNKGFSLEGGHYTLLCDFSAKNGSRVDDVEAAIFEVPHHGRPLYQGGFEEAACNSGEEITLKAVFVDAKGNEIEPVYYDELGKKMDSNVFECYGVGIYAVTAIATDEYGSQSESHEANIYVMDIDADLFPVDDPRGKPARY